MRKLIFTMLLALLAGNAGQAFPAEKSVTLDVPGMTCALCPITVRKALEKVNGVSKVSVSLEKKEAVVTFDDGKTSANALMKATGEAGYPATVKGSK